MRNGEIIQVMNIANLYPMSGSVFSEKGCLTDQNHFEMTKCRKKTFFGKKGNSVLTTKKFSKSKMFSWTIAILKTVIISSATEKCSSFCNEIN